MKASDNVFPKIIVSEGAAPATPAAGTVVVYAKADGLMYSKDDAGVETPLGASGGGSGDVVGPASSTNSHVALFDGVTGKLLKDGGALGTAAFSASSDFATVAQGAAADSAVQPGDLAAIATTGAVGDLTGFPGGTTNFLRADGTFAAPAGGGTGVVETVVAGTGIDVDATDPANPVVSIDNTAVTPGSYTSANITVDAQGRITAAANGSGGGGPSAATLLLSSVDELGPEDSAELPELDAAGALTGTAMVYLVDDAGNSVRTTLAALKTFINTDPTVVPSSVPWKGCRVALSAAQSIPNATFTTASWGAEAVDTHGFWSIGSPTRLVVPAGVTKVRLTANVTFDATTTSGIRSISLNKNGAPPAGGFATASPVASTVGSTNASSAVLDVVEGDYFELRVYQNSGAARDIVAVERTWFQIEVVEGSI